MDAAALVHKIVRRLRLSSCAAFTAPPCSSCQRASAAATVSCFRLYSCSSGVSVALDRSLMWRSSGAAPLVSFSKALLMVGRFPLERWREPARRLKYRLATPNHRSLLLDPRQISPPLSSSNWLLARSTNTFWRSAKDTTTPPPWRLTKECSNNRQQSASPRVIRG